jgi:hypothetical protein
LNGIEELQDANFNADSIDAKNGNIVSKWSVRSESIKRGGATVCIGLSSE